MTPKGSLEYRKFRNYMGIEIGLKTDKQKDTLYKFREIK